VTDETINHPSHYGGDTPYEAIKVIKAWGLGFCLGNAVKYISRAGKKGGEDKRLEDLRKALWYLEDEIGHHDAYDTCSAGRSADGRVQYCVFEEGHNCEHAAPDGTRFRVSVRPADLHRPRARVRRHLLRASADLDRPRDRVLGIRRAGPAGMAVVPMTDAATELARFLAPEQFGELMRWISEQPNGGAITTRRYTGGLTKHQIYCDAAVELVKLGINLPELMGYVLRQVVELLYLDDPRDVELRDVCMAYAGVHHMHPEPTALLAVKSVRDAYR